MALDPSTEPCSLLNATTYPTLFLRPTSTEADAYARIVSGGNLVQYDAILNAAGFDTTGAVLSSSASNPSSSLRLIQFLSGGGVGSASGSINYSQLQNVALYYLQGTARRYESIISSYVIGPPGGNNGLNMGTGYNPANLVSPATSLITPAKFWSPSDATADGSVIPSPSSLLGKLIKAGYLLSQAQIYNPGQLVPTATAPTAGAESLVYLYKLEQGTTPLTQTQTSLKNSLEATNLRFFGAFTAEYCFYRTRYEWLLRQYFTIYTQKTAANGGSGTSLYTAPSTGSPPFQLFGGPNPLPSTSSGSLSQSDYLSGLAYQMAALNMRMADMRTLLAAINTYYNGIFVLIQSNINSSNMDGSNSKLTQTITALQASSDKANKYLTEQDFAQQVMNYNSEKNRYSNILLGLYAFLNIAALASVFHLARS
jgi:hypothetical protein